MRRLFLLSVSLVFFISCSTQKKSNNNAGLMDELQQQLEYLIAETGDSQEVARSFENGKYTMASKEDWTCGFLPGTLWYMYELSGDEKWKKLAVKNTLKLDGLQYDTTTHDLGFMTFCSFGNAYRLTGDNYYKDVVLQASESLITRFDKNIGCIRSWDFGDWQFPVIIDNMMNLEMLLWASEETGDPKYKNIAISHANVTLKNHFRENMSSWHVVSYDTTNYGIEVKQTFQGLNNNSSWGRGQTWGLYGYTVMYRGTKDKKYLDAATKIADYILANLPEDKVSFWDFNDPKIPNTYRDASAASLAASALLELANYSSENKSTYLDVANQIIESLSSSEYRAKYGENGGFLLKHCVGHLPANTEIDVPLNYADYYYLEALIRQRNSLK